MKFSTFSSLKSSAFSLLFLSFASPAFAQGSNANDSERKAGPPDRGARFFEKMDEDGDGFISQDESRDATERFFSSIDENGDQVVTEEEAKAHRKTRRAAHRKGKGKGPGKMAKMRFKRMDKNGDGVITQDESKMPARLFERLDANDDQSISKKEFRKHMKALGKRHAKHGKARFAKMDQNNDGEVTLEEAQAASDEFFARLDQNQDQMVTREEAKSAMRRHHRRGNRGKKARSQESQ